MTNQSTMCIPAVWYLVNPPTGAHSGHDHVYESRYRSLRCRHILHRGRPSVPDRRQCWLHAVQRHDRQPKSRHGGGQRVDSGYAIRGSRCAAMPTSGQTQRLNQPISIGRTNDRLVMTTKGPISPAGTTTMSYSYSESSQVALSIVALRPASGPADGVAPSAPSGLTASGGARMASLNWSAATDNNVVTGYNVHRASVSRFTPTQANRIGQSASTSFTDTPLVEGTYFYVVTAQDGAGNVGGPSNEASAVVTPDTAAPFIAVDTVSSSPNGNNVGSVSWSHTITSTGSNVALVVGAVSRDSTDADRPVVSVTYNGINLTRIRQDDEPVNNVYSSVWYLVNPPTGAHSVTITYTSLVTEAFGAAISFTGVDQVSPSAPMLATRSPAARRPAKVWPRWRTTRGFWICNTREQTAPCSPRVRHRDSTSRYRLAERVTAW